MSEVDASLILIEPSARPAWTRGARLSCLVLLVGLGTWTALLVATSAFRFSIYLPRARLPLETLGAVVATLTFALVTVHYWLTGSRSGRLVAMAFLVLAVTHLVFGLFVTSGASAATSQEHIYLWCAASMLAGVLIILGVVDARSGNLSEHDRGLPFVAACMATLLAWVVIEGPLWIFRNDLPGLSAVTGSAAAGRLIGPLPGLTTLDIALGAFGAAIYLLAAWGCLQLEGQPWSKWLAPALVLAAFSHLHFMFFPYIFQDRLSTGDFLGLAFFVALLGGVIWDVRAAYAVERERSLQLQEAYEREQARVKELEDLDRAKAELFSLLTHELAHPVATLRGYILALSSRWDEMDNDTRFRVMDRMESQSRRLRDLAEEVVSVSQLDSSGFSIAVRPEAVRDIIRDASRAAAAVEERLEIEMSPDAQASSVLADRARLLQVFQNLLSNAQKYSSPDTVIRLGAGVNNGEVVFSVSDRGRGISKEDVGRLFQRFSRLYREGDSLVPGSGLGLYICRRIVERHGGRIWVESEPGEGSTFSFAVPGGSDS